MFRATTSLRRSPAEDLRADGGGERTTGAGICRSFRAMRRGMWRNGGAGDFGADVAAGTKTGINQPVRLQGFERLAVIRAAEGLFELPDHEDSVFEQKHLL